MIAAIAARPAHFDRVDRVKAAIGQPAQPGDTRVWILGDNLTFLVDGRVHCVPIGFTTTGASIPRLVRRNWWSGHRRWPTVCHNWLYAHPLAAKSYADSVLRALLHAEGVHWWKREALYFSAHWFSRRTWARIALTGPAIYEGAVMDDASAQGPPVPTAPGLPPEDFPEPGVPTMNLLDDPDDAPTLGAAAKRSQFGATPMWISSKPDDRHEDVVRFEAFGANYADLRQTATDMLAALLGEATVEGRVQMNLEIEPDVHEMGSELPASWRAEVTAVIPRH